ncbi:hypothetical protein TWF481_009431 [Arthrobotrys musiformis]|uniref:BZIP domain-containing protein n=1 Tax=Arthrobotrys musiformis TaxID=47236 RepID=A0AAV9W3T8_9PEZI
MSSSPDTDTQTTTSNAPTKRRRIRTDAQLEQKRARDRKSQRLSRAKNRLRIEQMEADLYSLKSRHESLLAAAEKIGMDTSLVLSLAGEAISAPSHDGAQIEPIESAITAFTNIEENVGVPVVDIGRSREAALVDVESSDDGGHCRVNLPSTVDNSPIGIDIDSCTFPPAADFNNAPNIVSAVQTALPPVNPTDNAALNSQSISGAIDLCETLLHNPVESPTPQLVPPDATDAGDLDIFHNSSGAYAESPTPTSTNTAPDCLCGIDDTQKHALHCISHRAVHLIVTTHAAIAAGMRKALAFPRSPSIPNLLLLDLDSNPLAGIVGRAMLNGSPTQLADSVATYFIIYRLLRWRICPTPETYYDLPEWYRPSELQKTWPHPLCIDLLAWPKLRDGIIPVYEQLDKLRLSRDIMESITVGWPETEPLLVKDFRNNTAVLNPKFEEHIWKFSNWRMGPLWALRQPRFVELVNMVEGY